MPVDNGVGHSSATINKQRGFAAILQQHLSTCKMILRKHEGWAWPVYQYIDANAGTGQNPDEECDGSPLIFLKIANGLALNYDAHLVEINPINGMRLKCCVANWNNCKIMIEDNKSAVPRIISAIPRSCYGLLYTDPNGVPDFGLLADVSRNPKLKYIDIVVRYAASSVKRTQHITGKKMLDYLGTINKKYWIIRELERGDKWQWTFLVGLNWDGLNAWKQQGFHYAHSDRGQEIIEQLNYTNAERAEMQQQPLIPYSTYEEYLAHPQYKAVRAEAIERSGGT
jgi:hypothetical protein